MQGGVLGTCMWTAYTQTDRTGTGCTRSSYNYETYPAGRRDTFRPRGAKWRKTLSMERSMKARDRVHKGVPGDYQRDLEGSVRLPAPRTCGEINPHLGSRGEKALSSGKLF